MKVSIFDRFVSRETGGQEKKAPHTTPYRRMFSELEDAGQELRERDPEDAGTVDAFVQALKELSRERRKKALGIGMPAMNAEASFFLSRDRLRAYACLLPPENGGEGLGLEAFLGDLYYEGIVFGVLDKEEIRRDFDRGYFHIFPVARGTAPQAGEDGEVTELFQRRKSMRLEMQNGSEADFGQDVPLQPIRKGTVICQIRPPKPGTDGMDVTGQVLPPPQTASARVPRGENTVLSRDGLALVAEADGILYMENDLFCIHAQKIIDGNLDQFGGTLRISGNLYIGGNVDGGAEIEASGEIVINGTLGAARVVSAGGTIRVQKGVYGVPGKTSLRAANQVQAPVIERAEITAGAGVIAETVSGSTIRCGGTVYVMTGRGMIIDSRILTGDSILCLRVGNLAGGSSRFSVGYPVEVMETWKSLREELAGVQATVDKLWGSITELQKKGSRIPDSEKALLGRLLEQRELYIRKREALAVRLKAANQALNKPTKGRIRCEKLYPLLEVQIGRLTEKVETVEEACNIHVEENQIVLK